ncbi:MAG: ornithine aminomutase subunit alpha [Firmicutes bacterium]|jgi:D-ornithine 4,5-aminomutase subunit alpha|nr:ornithine aminomutase subunit alpha [Bacillota bacterium]MCR5182282.1 ornithine aminomutase subunit alpha [Clostridia bacterium]MEE3382711.1 ornithine aminomutase subunit alpha [Anaerovoracaceae bacterium]MBQ1430326.1 ornithine aminomutase subunit alpha [Bacillota bacterium]MBQ1630410.1 ornithine aminomutase subunit alpha [Bacillota bacterium]
MKREDDFEVRHQHLKDLTDQELYDRFWDLIRQVDEPLLKLGYENTTPSVERAVLMRMGVSSLDTQKIVNHCMDHGLMGKGAGHCVYKLSKLENISIRDASIKLAEGEGWDKVVAAFKGGK